MYRVRCLCSGLPVCERQGKSLRNGSTYSYISADDSALSKSSSGALAHDLTADYLEHGESVTGCALRDRGTRAVHITLPSAEGDASAFQGSKYIQSDFRRAFDTLMLDGRHLVIGTPCEIAAMRNVIEARAYRTVTSWSISSVTGCPPPISTGSNSPSSGVSDMMQIHR